jgi:quercetin dioxygenase-like cupin family protein
LQEQRARPPGAAESSPGRRSPSAARSGEQIRAIGAEIRVLRRARGLSLRDLSGRTGLSIGFLSLVERGLSSLALTSLYAVAAALETDVSHFFPGGGTPRVDPGSRPLVTRAGEEAGTTLDSRGRSYRMLSGPFPAKVLEPLLITLQPTDSEDRPYGHEGEEFLYVLEGELIYEVEGVAQRLGPGDSIHARATVPHALRNESDRLARAIWVVTPPLIR